MSILPSTATSSIQDTPVPTPGGLLQPPAPPVTALYVKHTDIGACTCTHMHTCLFVHTHAYISIHLLALVHLLQLPEVLTFAQQLAQILHVLLAEAAVRELPRGAEKAGKGC